MRLIKKVIAICIVLVILFSCLIIALGYFMYRGAINKIDLDTKIEEIKKDEEYIVYNELPEKYITAVTDVEDQRFFSHSGIDIISIGRAIITNIQEKGIVQGGSTITQQVAKNMYFTQEKSFVRKVAELFVVYDLEKNYTKEDIFELYVNISYFGDGYYGIGEASIGYLKKLPKDMTLSECTLLAGIPNAPSVYAPTRNPDLALERQKQVINKMAAQGDLTEKEVNELLSEIDKAINTQ